MYLISCLIAWSLGALFIAVAKLHGKKEEVNYAQYPTAEATVIGTYKFYGSRWMARFENETGEEVIGADDVYAESTFFPKKHSIPKRGNVERVYYWRDNDLNSHRIGGSYIRYMFHFCNESFYDLHKKRTKRMCVSRWIMGLVLIAIGIVILLINV